MTAVLNVEGAGLKKELTLRLLHLLISLSNHDGSHLHPTNTIIKFADSTAMVGVTRDDDEEVTQPTDCCSHNNLDWKSMWTLGNPKRPWRVRPTGALTC